MANTTLKADVVAKAALAILENELGWINDLYRAPEEEFSKSVNGYKIGDTLSIRRPADFIVRPNKTLAAQDVIEGKTTITVDQQIGVDFAFTSSDLTLRIGDLSERVIKPAMSSIVNYMANDLLQNMYQGAYNWVGTPANTISNYAGFARGAERLDLMSVPQDGRIAVLSPTDNWGLLGSQTALYIDKAANDAYRKGSLGEIGGIKTYMSQVVPTHTNGTAASSATTVVSTATNTVTSVTYDDAKNSWTQTLYTKGWGAASTLKAGTVFTISGVFMVNPKTKAKTSVLQQFVVTADATTNATTTSDTALTISPPIIPYDSGNTKNRVFQTVDVAPANGATITIVGSASTGYVQNMAFHKNSMALAVVPLELPPAAYGASRESYKNLSVRVIPVYDGTSDTSTWRLDLLYGRKLIDPRLVTRMNG